MLDSKKVIIRTVATVATAIVVDTTICIVKGRDCLKIANLISEMGIYYGICGGLAEYDEVHKFNELLNRTEKLGKELGNKKSRSFTIEDRTKARLLRMEVEAFYNTYYKPHCN